MKQRAQFADLADGRLFRVRVTPNADRNALEGDPSGDFDLRIRVTAPPENDKANRMAVRLLAAALGVPKGRIALVRGGTSRDKQFRVT